MRFILRKKTVHERKSERERERKKVQTNFNNNENYIIQRKGHTERRLITVEKCNIMKNILIGSMIQSNKVTLLQFIKKNFLIKRCSSY